jgi:hypothetical protein
MGRDILAGGGALNQQGLDVIELAFETFDRRPVVVAACRKQDRKDKKQEGPEPEILHTPVVAQIDEDFVFMDRRLKRRARPAFLAA